MESWEAEQSQITEKAGTHFMESGQIPEEDIIEPFEAAQIASGNEPSVEQDLDDKTLSAVPEKRKKKRKVPQPTPEQQLDFEERELVLSQEEGKVESLTTEVNKSKDQERNDCKDNE